jgi:hypothetical protein
MMPMITDWTSPAAIQFPEIVFPAFDRCQDAWLASSFSICQGMDFLVKLDLPKKGGKMPTKVNTSKVILQIVG